MLENYENISELKAAIISAFQEVSDGTWRTMEDFDRRLEMVLRNKGGHLKNKIVMCMCRVYIKILMLSVYLNLFR